MPWRPIQSFRGAASILFGGLAMLLVAVLCAFFTLRVAIHGREVAVPNLGGKSDADAAVTAKKLGLNLTVEDRFYSPAVPPNQVLSQSPVAGSRVRRGWQVRVTESLGAQVVSVPDVVGQRERPATLVLRRLQLDLGPVAHLPAPSPQGVVLAQSPPSNSKEMNGPRVALLLSDVETDSLAPAFVMPSLIGETLFAASNRLSSAGLHIASIETLNDEAANAAPAPSSTPEVPSFSRTVSAPATVVGQSPSPGHRVTRSDSIRLTMSH